MQINVRPDAKMFSFKAKPEHMLVTRQQMKEMNFNDIANNRGKKPRLFSEMDIK